MNLCSKLVLPLAGCATLILEVVLMRVATKFLGEGALATTTTLSIFLLGMGLPPLWYARYGAKQKSKYLGAGLFALLALLTAPLYIASPTNTTADWLICAALILLPASACGLILPIFADFKNSQNNLNYLLFNAGAAIGSGSAGLLLLPQLGLTATVHILTVLFILSSLLALASTRGEQQLDGENIPANKTIDSTVLFVAISSMLCLLCESLMIRLVTTLVGSSVTALALVVSIYIAGLALGNALAIGCKNLTRDTSIFSWLALLVVLDLTAISLGLPYLPTLFLYLQSTLASLSLPLILASIVICFILCLPLATIFGWVFPAANKHSGADNFARLLGVATASSVLAPWIYFAALTYQIPAIGDSVFLGLLKMCLIGSAVLSLIYTPKDSIKSRVKTTIKSLPGTLVLLSYLSSPPEQKQALTTGPIFLPADKSWQKLLSFERQNQKLVFYGDGLLDSVGLLEDTNRQQQVLVSSGKIEAVRSPLALPAQYTHLLLALLPQVMSQPNPDVLVIGMGLNITADTFCQLPVKSVSVVEIEKQIVNANKIARERRTVLSGQNRESASLQPEIIVSDARRYLSANATKYDIISCQPSEPWVNGSGSLFTAEFLALTKSKLKQDGVFTQWLQLYGLPQKDFLAYLKIFSETYPDCLLFHQSGAGEIILLGKNSTISSPLAGASTLTLDLNTPAGKLWNLAGITSQEQLNDSFFTADQLKDLLGRNAANVGARTSTDDNLALQYQVLLPDLGTNVTERTIRSNLLLLDALRSPNTRH